MNILANSEFMAPVDEPGLLDMCQRLIRLQSYTGDEGRMAAEVRKTMQALGYSRAWIDEFGNVVGEIRGKLPGPSILFDGHIDTVDVTDAAEWDVPHSKE